MIIADTGIFFFVVVVVDVFITIIIIHIQKYKKGIRFSGHFLQKQMRQAVSPPPPKKITKEATFFFFFTPSNLTLNLNANISGKYVSYAFFLG